jgi:hypothetical protein
MWPILSYCSSWFRWASRSWKAIQDRRIHPLFTNHFHRLWYGQVVFEPTTCMWICMSWSRAPILKQELVWMSIVLRNHIVLKATTRVPNSYPHSSWKWRTLMQVFVSEHLFLVEIIIPQSAIWGMQQIRAWAGNVG